MNVNNSNREVDKSDEDKSDESKIDKKLDAIFKGIKNNGRTSKPISVKSYGSSINLHPVIIKLLNARKTGLKNDRLIW